MMLRDQLLACADAYVAAMGIAPATLSTWLFNDGRRLARMAGGGDIGTVHFERVMGWFADHWPETARWPDGVPRRPRPVSIGCDARDAACRQEP